MYDVTLFSYYYARCPSSSYVHTQSQSWEQSSWKLTAAFFMALLTQWSQFIREFSISQYFILAILSLNRIQEVKTDFSLLSSLTEVKRSFLPDIKFSEFNLQNQGFNPTLGTQSPVLDGWPHS